jgi:hypothetical protein
MYTDSMRRAVHSVLCPQKALVLILLDNDALSYDKIR